VREHGESYESYRRSVPMLVPSFGTRKVNQGVEPEPFHAELKSKI
jgi:hypothetical protein